MRFLTSLYVTDHRARISFRDGSLLVTRGDGSRTRVPVEAVDGIVMIGHAQVTSEALAACAARHVRVSSLQGNGRIRYIVGGALGGNVHLRLAQYEAARDQEQSLRLARWLVAGKLQNARRMVQRWCWDAKLRPRRHLEKIEVAIRERIARVPSANSADSARGFEGEGTRLYFEAMRAHLGATDSGFEFETRTRRPPRDPVNAALSFAYGIVLTEVTGALESVGLDTQIGFLHGVRAGRPSLALDLMEELRPTLADRFVVGMLARRSLSVDDFISTPGGACYLADGSRRAFLAAYESFKSETVHHAILDRDVPRAALPLVQSILLARYLRGDLPAYPPYVSEA